jgi:hypothetical protein
MPACCPCAARSSTLCRSAPTYLCASPPGTLYGTKSRDPPSATTTQSPVRLTVMLHRPGHT